MKALQELLPFLILVAVTVGGKVLEGMKQKRLEEARKAQVPPDLIPKHVNTPRIPEPERAPVRPASRSLPQAPPVAQIPDPLRNIMRTLGVDLPPPPPVHKPHVEHHKTETKHPERRTHVVAGKDVQVADHAFKLEVTPDALRKGILWKAILDEPRFKRPWAPMR